MAAVGTSLALAVAGALSDPGAAYYSTSARGWELGAGVVLAILAPRFRGLGPRVRTALGFAALVALEVAAVAWLQPAYPFPPVFSPSAVRRH